jgi:hypothetical protein
MIAGISVEQLLLINTVLTSMLFLLVGMLAVMLSINRGEIREAEDEAFDYYRDILQSLEEADIIEIDREEKTYEVKE